MAMSGVDRRRRRRGLPGVVGEARGGDVRIARRRASQGRGRRTGSWLPRMLELAPARFSAAVVEDPGCNLSFWNLHLHSLEAADGRLLVDGEAPRSLARSLGLPAGPPTPAERDRAAACG